MIIIYILYKFMKKDYNVILPLKILQRILSPLASTFFLPMLFILLSALDCTPEKKNHYTDDLQCYNTFYYINAGIAIISLIFYIPFSLLSNLIFYEYSLGGDKILSKTTAIPDLFFTLTKVIISFIFVIINGGEETHYFLILILTFFSFIVCVLNFKYPRYNENTLNYIHKFLSLTVFWSSFVLLIGKIFRSSSFNGCLGLFFATEPIMFLLILYERKTIQEDLYKEKNSFDVMDSLQYIKSYINVVENKDTNRNSELILKGYISLFEERCFISECPLKKYLTSLKNGNDIKGFLYQHAETLFQNCLKKFPTSTEVRFAYALFLLKKMNKKKKAQNLLIGLDKFFPTLEEEFIIYRCKRMFENDLTELEKQDVNNIEIIRELEYKKYSNEFKDLINNASQLYIDFWGQLLSSRLSGSEEITKLNEYGVKINKVVEQLNKSFEKIQKIKNNDYEILRIYYDFLLDILNNKEKAIKLKNIIDDIDEVIEISEENEFGNINIASLSTNDDYCYIIISANNEIFGTIQNISLSACLIFGFQKDELIGKPLELLIPDTFQEEHKKVLQKKLIEFKKTSVGKISNYYSSEIKELDVYGRNKSKYLIPLNLKVNIILNENNECFFIASISKEHVFYNTYNKNNTEIIKQCIVLTNPYLLIQNFTPNAFDILGLTSEAINSNIEITYFIKQFYEEFLQIASECYEQNLEKKYELKKSILMTKFKNPRIINWKKSDYFDKKNTSKTIDFSPNYIQKKRHSIIQNSFITDENFLLTVKEAFLNNKLQGYYFQFEKYNNDLSPTSSNKLLSLNSLKTTANQKKKKKSKTELTTISNTINLNNFNPSNYTTIYNTNNNTLNIRTNFIPDSNFNFQLNPENFYFEGRDNYDNTLTEYLKNEVFEKINSEKNESIYFETSEEIEEEEEENEEEEEESGYIRNSEIDESSQFSPKNKKNSSLLYVETTTKKKSSFSNFGGYTSTNSNVNSNKQEDDFYKINFSKIKYSIYDYNQGIPIEIKDYDKIYQVNKKLQEFIKKRENNEKNINENITNKGKNAKGNTTHNMERLIFVSETQESILSKEIEYALTKEDVDESISKFNKISFLVFTLILGIGFIILFFILHSIKIIKMNSELIMNSYLLILFNYKGIYYTKELILLNNENYTEIPSRNSRNEYLTNIYNSTQEICFESHKLIANTIASPIKLSSNASWMIKNESFVTRNIKSDFNVSETYTTMESSFVETNSALFNIGNKNIKLIIPTNEDVYFYLHNCLNNVGIQYLNQGEIFLNELKKNVKNIKIFLIIGYIFFILILISIFILVNYAYDGVSKRKESYIEVFFEIDTKIIRNSLLKCENFNRKLQNNEENDDEDDLLSPTSNNETPLIKKNEPQNEKNRIKKGKNAFTSNMIFKIKFMTFILIIIIFFSIVFAFKYLFLENVKLYQRFFQNQVEYNTEIYRIFNALREVYFDMNQKIKNIKADDFLNNELDEVYKRRKKNLIIINKYKDKLPNDFGEKYNKLLKKHPCEFRSDNYFLNEEECLNFMSNSTSYGMNILISYFIEEIRFFKKLFLVYTSLEVGLNNLTLTGTNKGKSLWPIKEPELSKYSKNDPIHFFNMEYMKNMNIMISNIIFNYDNNLTFLMKNCIIDFLKTTKIPYLIMMIGYLSLCFISFLFIWLPFLNNLNSLIYKTKKMLSIIPKEVLASIENIEKLLDLNKNNIPNQKKSKKKNNIK